MTSNNDMKFTSLPKTQPDGMLYRLEDVSATMETVMSIKSEFLNCLCQHPEASCWAINLKKCNSSQFHRYNNKSTRYVGRKIANNRAASTMEIEDDDP